MLLLVTLLLLIVIDVLLDIGLSHFEVLPRGLDLILQLQTSHLETCTLVFNRQYMFAFAVQLCARLDIAEQDALVVLIRHSFLQLVLTFLEEHTLSATLAELVKVIQLIEEVFLFL